MQIVRARYGNGVGLHGGVLTRQGFHALPVDLDELLEFPLRELRRVVEDAAAAPPARPSEEVPRLGAPVCGLTEVWAAGVTYERSRAARMTESEHEADIYERVYGAERPELFFKAASWRVVGPDEPVSVRADSAVNVPEPELAVVANRFGEIVGYTICDDVSSRSIEGENSLYLPQAKAYLGACALGPGITPVWEVNNPYALGMELTISREGRTAWEGRSSTELLRRELPELLAYLFRADEFPQGVVLATGTSLVPELPFTLAEGDVVHIGVAGLGALDNPVVVGKEAMAWLLDRAAHGRASGGRRAMSAAAVAGHTTSSEQEA
ncbi:fumarylacetoacetate hydrolase family protein [Streptomyces brasiliensis]|uniref:Fumarylacetoacetate (FAA) hydrolase n=1 Tax=Streptomyces brasiliensis TaxID=1954 RepID=A0A917L1W0_9ACTN|nr:fumarylacetoacetate hydrolase family protein [Streptomyces brasiliensis]GGJ40566.1 fumarylacetoacetate (FAA) hydrolase [Streptomyces brasiliensis]